MKNTIYFDNKLDFILLENEENDLNSIYIDIDTDANTNQLLEVMLGSTTYSFGIPSSSSVDFELEGSYWATAGDTAFRLKNDSYTSEWITITFPDEISTDATLLKLTDRSFEMQGQTSEAQELKTQVIRWTNTRDYSIGTNEQRVIAIKYVCQTTGTNGLFNCTINLEAEGIEESATLTARIRINKEFDEYFIPRQKLTNGAHVLTISYPVMGIPQYSANQLDVYLSVDSGTVTVAQQQALASIIAAGLAFDNEWNGEIECEDTVGTISLEQISVDPIVSIMSAELQTPSGGTLTQSLGTISLQAIRLGGVTEAFALRPWLSEMTWNEASAMIWDTAEEEYIWGL